MTSEDLWRAVLHDFNNILAGLQGVMDLSDPRLPLDTRNRMRMEYSIEEGKTLISMARALVLDRHPEAGVASWADWKAALNGRLEPMSTLFRCPIDLVDKGADGCAWPTPQLVEWTAAFTRQILPWVAPGPLRLEATVTPEAWNLTWIGDAPMPTALQADSSPDTPKNIHAFWLRAMGERLGISILETPAGLVARMARPAVSL
jgi:hypothetical protein